MDLSDQVTGPKPDYGRVISAAVESVQKGRMPSELLLDLVREHPEETAEFCILKLSDPNLDSAQEAMITNLVHQAVLAHRLVQRLNSLELNQAKLVALRLRNTEKGLDLKIAEYLQSKDADVVIKALDLLDAVGKTPQLMPLLFGAMKAKSTRIQSRIASLIQKMDTEHIYTRRLMQHADPRIRANALQAIGDREDSKGDEFLLAGASDPDNRVRTLAAVGLTRRGDPKGMSLLLKMIRDSNPVERRSAAWGLGACGHTKSRTLLESLSQNDSDARVRELAAEGLRKLQQGDGSAEK